MRENGFHFFIFGLSIRTDTKESTIVNYSPGPVMKKSAFTSSKDRLGI